MKLRFFKKPKQIGRRRRAKWPRYERSFYRFICKEGVYGRMVVLDESESMWMRSLRGIEDGGKFYYREHCPSWSDQGYVAGYPRFGTNTNWQGVWREKSDKAFDKARDRNVSAIVRWKQFGWARLRRQARIKSLLQHERRKNFGEGFKRQFQRSGVHIMDVPIGVLKLSQRVAEAKRCISELAKAA